MTYTVSSGTLNSSIPYHLQKNRKDLISSFFRVVLLTHKETKYTAKNITFSAEIINGGDLWHATGSQPVQRAVASCATLCYAASDDFFVHILSRRQFNKTVVTTTIPLPFDRRSTPIRLQFDRATTIRPTTYVTTIWR